VTEGFNFLEQPELPAPQVSETQAEYLLLKHYGINARAESLGSQQDKNFRVLDSDDRPFGVLKIANPRRSPRRSRRCGLRCRCPTWRARSARR
jgi:Ser/Thr protein kinase RdoA (MazF antagonist)